VVEEVVGIEEVEVVQVAIEILTQQNHLAEEVLLKHL